MILSISNRGYFRLKSTIFLLSFLFLVPSIVHGQSRKEQVASLKNKKVVYVWGGGRITIQKKQSIYLFLG